MLRVRLFFLKIDNLSNEKKSKTKFIFKTYILKTTFVVKVNTKCIENNFKPMFTGF